MFCRRSWRLVVLVLALFFVAFYFKNVPLSTQSFAWKESNGIIASSSRKPPVSEDAYFEIEMKLKFLLLNYEHRVDFLREALKRLSFFRELASQTSKETTIHIDSQRKKIKAKLELLLLVNRFKSAKLKSIGDIIETNLHRLQDTKCRLDNIVYVNLEQICGFGCHIHTFQVALLISYYWERTLIFAKKNVSGFEEFENIFLPIAKRCRLHDSLNTTIYDGTFRPYKVSRQEWNGEKFFIKFKREARELSKYHSDPVAFLIGNFIKYILRFNTNSAFYDSLQKASSDFGLTSPYVGIHVRRSDKSNEARFYEIEEYMAHVEEFFEVYFLKYPDRVNNTKRTVFVASDELGVFESLVEEYPEYRFVFNNSATNVAGSFEKRFSKTGLESIIFDLHFLSNADYLVCTFSSNICRLAYELMSAKRPDTYSLAKSLDVHYYNYFEIKNYQIAVAENHEPDFHFKKGDMVEKFIFSGHSFQGYHGDGYMHARMAGTTKGGVYASYKTKDYY